MWTGLVPVDTDGVDNGETGARRIHVLLWKQFPCLRLPHMEKTSRGSGLCDMIVFLESKMELH